MRSCLYLPAGLWPALLIIFGLFGGGLLLAVSESLGFFAPLGEQSFTLKHYLALFGDQELRAALRLTLWLATLATWVIIAAFFRYSSLAAIVAAVFAPFYQLLIWGFGPAAISVAVMGLLLVWRHSANIQKLLKGTESKLGQKAAGAAVHVPPAKHAHKHSHKHPTKHGEKT